MRVSKLVDRGNTLLGLDVVIRDDEGVPLDVESLSLLRIYEAHISSQRRVGNQLVCCFSTVVDKLSISERQNWKRLHEQWFFSSFVYQISPIAQQIFLRDQYRIIRFREEDVYYVRSFCHQNNMYMYIIMYIIFFQRLLHISMESWKWKTRGFESEGVVHWFREGRHQEEVPYGHQSRPRGTNRILECHNEKTRPRS